MNEQAIPETDNTEEFIFVPTPQQEDAIEELLGQKGRMVFPSKMLYREQFPDHLVIFNAQLSTNQGKFWWGDLDITKDYEKLYLVAKILQEDVYVMVEMDGRVQTKKDPLFQYAVVRFSPAGAVVLATNIFDNYRKLIPNWVESDEDFGKKDLQQTKEANMATTKSTKTTKKTTPARKTASKKVVGGSKKASVKSTSRSASKAQGRTARKSTGAKTRRSSI